MADELEKQMTSDSEILTTEEQIAAPVLEIDRSKGKWYVLHVLTSREYKVRETVQNIIKSSDENCKIYEVAVPVTYETVYNKKNQATLKERKINPGYVYVRADLYDQNNKLLSDVFSSLRMINGVMAILPRSTNPEQKPRPIPLNQEEADHLIDLLSIEKPDPASNVKIPKFLVIGSMVTIIEGNMAGLPGKVERIDKEKGKAYLSVEIFSRKAQIECEFRQVGPYNADVASDGSDNSSK